MLRRTSINFINKKLKENNFDIISSTLAKNQSDDFYKLLGFLKKASVKSEIAYLARFDRQKLINQRYQNYKNFYLKKLQKNKFYIVNNKGHLKHLKYLFENENVGFVFRNNIWLLLPDKKILMNQKDKNLFKKIEI